jgi:PAS domain S-box-containing protein
MTTNTKKPILQSSAPVSPVAVVVNDDPLQLELFSSLLIGDGLEVRRFDSAASALDSMSQSAPPDVIITDLYMPGIDGWRFCRLLRSPDYAPFNSVPIMAVSATFAGAETTSIAADLGANAFLSSPVDRHEFLGQVRQLLRGERPQKILRVLIVDDEEILAELLRQTFAAHGYEADTALTGRDAEAAFQSRVYDVVIVDEHLPDISGLDLMEKLQQHRSEVVFLTMTGDSRPELALDCMKRGAAAFVQKPFAPQYLVEVCAKARRERDLVWVEHRLEIRSRELRQSEERFAAFMAHLPAAAFVKDADGRTLFVNKYLQELLGFKEWSGRTTEELVSGEPGRKMVLDDRKALFEGHLKTQDIITDTRGVARAFETIKFQVPVPGRSPLLGGIAMDITQRKQLEEELTAANARLEALWGVSSLPTADIHTIADHILAAIAKLTRSAYGFYGLVNEDESVLTIHAWSGETTNGCSVAQIPTGFPIAQAGVWAEALRRREPLIVSDYAAHPTAKRGLPIGHLPLTNLLIVPRIVRGRIQALAAVANRAAPYTQDDVTQLISFLDHIQAIVEAKQAEAEKEKLQAQLAQAQKMESVGRLAGGVAHDFNNMLGVILGNVTFALQLLPQESFLQEPLQDIERCAQRSADLTRQLLAFARKQTVAPKVLDLNATVEGILKMLRRLIGEDIVLAWVPAPELWPVKIDPTQIDQVLANLCVNARDAIEGVGEVTLQTGNITVDAAQLGAYPGFAPGDYVLLTLSDSGCGMDQEVLGHLFEPFFTTKGPGQGTGLGLATVYGIVRQNGGYITVETEPGRGTAFRIYLPRYTGKTTPVEPPVPAPAPTRGRETILLVEDETLLLQMTKRLLENLGYTVLAAATPGEAFRLAAEYPADIQLLLSDVVMPEMNGRELAERLLEVYPNLKRLFMSGYTADVIAHHGVLDEGIHFLQKPFSLQTLADMVRRTIEVAS